MLLHVGQHLHNIPQRSLELYAELLCRCLAGERRDGPDFDCRVLLKMQSLSVEMVLLVLQMCRLLDKTPPSVPTVKS